MLVASKLDYASILTNFFTFSAAKITLTLCNFGGPQ